MPQEIINMLNERALGGRGGAMRADIDARDDAYQLGQPAQPAENELVIELDPPEQQRNQIELVDQLPINLDYEEVPENLPLRKLMDIFDEVEGIIY